MREDTTFCTRHGVLTDEHDAVVQMVAKIVVCWCRPSLNQFRGWIDLVYRQRPAAVVSVPDYDLARSRCAGASDSRVDFSREEITRLHVPALSRQHLLVAIVHTPYAFEIGDDEDPGALGKRDEARQENPCKYTHDVYQL